MAKAPKTRSAKKQSTTSRGVAKAPPAKKRATKPKRREQGLPHPRELWGSPFPDTDERTRQPRQFRAWTRDFGECTSGSSERRGSRPRQEVR